MGKIQKILSRKEEIRRQNEEADIQTTHTNNKKKPLSSQTVRPYTVEYITKEKMEVNNLISGGTPEKTLFIQNKDALEVFNEEFLKEFGSGFEKELDEEDY